MKVEIWSDVVCPWCYIGKRRFEAALAAFPHRDEVEIEWRSFELDPTASTEPPAAREAGLDHASRLAAKYGISVAQARQLTDSVTAAAAAEGLDFRLDQTVRANTFDAHQVIHLAKESGLQADVKERLLRAYFTDGEAVGESETLVGLAVDAGLDAEKVRSALAEQRYASGVRADEAEASALGIHGVPFFVVDRTYGVSGAQPSDQLLAVLERAWTEAHPLTVVGSESATACGPDGCAL